LGRCRREHRAARLAQWLPGHRFRQGCGARKNHDWFGAPGIDVLSIDGPFVTDDRFVLFIDMTVTDRATGKGRPFNEIAVFTVRDGKIVEERFFCA